MVVSRVHRVDDDVYYDVSDRTPVQNINKNSIINKQEEMNVKERNK